jgi:predicted GNAT superfamily acetyltransferase
VDGTAGDWARAASDAAARSGVEIGLMEDVSDMARADAVFAAVWGSGQMAANLQKAMAHCGHYLAVARRDGRVVAAAVGFVHGPHHPPALHSHIAGVDPPLQGRGIGRALKLHQAAWAASRGLEAVTWTFDPMIRRNAWFNLAKLGATGDSWHQDFYGAMADGINAGEPSDRMMAVWRLDGPLPGAGADRDATTGTVLLRVGDDGGPERPGDAGALGTGDRLLCQVPPDHVALRRRDAALGSAWREAVRATVGAAMTAGYRAVSMTREGFYVLERSGR